MTDGQWFTGRPKVAFAAKVTEVRRWAWPIFVVGVIGLALVGAYIGRTIRVACDRPSGSCRVEVSGLLYPIDRFRFATADVTGVYAAVESSEVRSGRDRFDSTSAAVVIDRAGDQESIRLDAFGFLRPVTDVQEAAQKLDDFVRGKGTSSIEIEYGDPASAVVAILLLYIAAFGPLAWAAVRRVEIQLDAFRDAPEAGAAATRCRLALDVQRLAFGGTPSGRKRQWFRSVRHQDVALAPGDRVRAEGCCLRIDSRTGASVRVDAALAATDVTRLAVALDAAAERAFSGSLP